VNNPAAPTTANTIQNFCQIAQKRVSDLDPSGATIQWYKATAPGSKLLKTDLLTTAVYFARTIGGACESDDSVSVTVNVSSVMNVTISKVDNKCFGHLSGQITLDVLGGTQPFKFEWSGVATAFKNAQNQTKLKAGNYSVTVSDKFGCQQIESVQITEPLKINLIASVTHQPTCQKNNGEITAVSVLPLGNYQIKLLSSIPQSVISSNKITNLPANELYEVYVTNGNGCSSDTINLVVNPAKVIPGKWVIQQFDPTCKVEKGSVVIKSPKGLGFTYYLNNDNVSTTRDTVFSGLKGVNKITVFSKDNCLRDTTITIADKPDVTDRIDLKMKEAVCVNTTVDQMNRLILPNGYTLKWYDKDPTTTSNLLPINTATKLTKAVNVLYYTFTQNGKCESISNKITVKTSDVGVVDQRIVNTKCGTNTGLIELYAVNGIGKYTYSWSTQFQSNYSDKPLIQNLTEDIYVLKVTDSIGCEFEKEYTILCDLSKIPQIITPGEKTNNKWVLNYTKKFPKVQVDIFNRWGSLVYKSPVPYNDEEGWDGTPNVGGTLGSERLPSGTYYYVIDRGNGDPIETGFIELLN
jgi:gliding motility-associated-like protein